jgi:hypothetical protein
MYRRNFIAALFAPLIPSPVIAPLPGVAGPTRMLVTPKYVTATIDLTEVVSSDTYREYINRWIGDCRPETLKSFCDSYYAKLSITGANVNVAS